MDASIEFYLDMIKKGDRRLYDISGKIDRISPHLPINKALHNRFLESIKNSTGSVTKIVGMLSSVPSKVTFKPVIQRIVKENKNLEYYKLFKLESGSHIKTNFYVVSPINLDVCIDTPYLLTMKNYGMFGDNTFFLLMDFEPSFITISEVPDIGLMDIDAMRKSLRQITSLGYTEKTNHIMNSILGNYIGSDFIKKNTIVDGLNSSYIGDLALKEDLKMIHNTLSNKNFTIPLQFIGTSIHFDGDLSKIESLRKINLGRFKTISWNLYSLPNLDNLKKSEFKYTLGTDSLNIETTKDIENNQDFLQSLLFYINKNKRVSEALYHSIYNDVLIKVNKLVEGGKGSFITKVVDSLNIGTQIGRIISYNLAFDTKENEITQNVMNTIEHNIEDILEVATEQREMERSLEIQRKEKEKGVSLKVILAFNKIPEENRTRENVIESLRTECDFKENRAAEEFENLHREGIIFSPDGVHWIWTNENLYDF